MIEKDRKKNHKKNQVAEPVGFRGPPISAGRGWLSFQVHQSN